MTRPVLSFRLLFALGFLGCAAAMGVALFIEYGLGFEPCPLCVAQRIVMITMGLVFLAGAVHAPKARGRWIYAGATAFVAVLGVGLAARHVYVQHLPPDEVAACLPTLTYMLQMLPFQQVVMMVLKGDASCATIQFTVLGLSLPGWTLIAFSGFVIYCLAAPVIARKMEAPPA